MAELITARTTSQGYYSKAAVKRKYLPKKPANGGIPAKDNMKMDKTAAKKGLCFPSPLKAANDSSPFCSATTKNAPNAPMVATAYVKR